MSTTPQCVGVEWGPAGSCWQSAGAVRRHEPATVSQAWRATARNFPYRSLHQHCKKQTNKQKNHGTRKHPHCLYREWDQTCKNGLGWNTSGTCRVNWGFIYDESWICCGVPIPVWKGAVGMVKGRRTQECTVKLLQNWRKTATQKEKTQEQLACFDLP